MEVITIESEAFQQILKQLEEIKAGVLDKEKKTLAALWLDNDEVAALLKVSKRTLQNYRDEGAIPFSQVGAKIYYRSFDIENFLQRHYKTAFKQSR
jgi:hypothetical protein